MKNIIFAALIVCAALVQSTLVRHIQVFGVKPDLFWIMVLAGALYFDAGTAVIFSLICGLLKDSLGLPPFGVYIILFPLWSLAISSLTKRISFDHMGVSCLFLFVMVFVNAIILRFIPFVPGGSLRFMAFMRVSLIESLYTALLFIWIGPRIRRLALSTLW
jgi:rod shape-determining protein MreD